MSLEMKEMKWIKPVADRTEEDIKNKTCKAYLNKKDLNRIEGNIEYLSNELESQLYRVERMHYTEWNREKIPTVEDMRRICGNITEITEKYYEPEGFKDISYIADKPLTYEDINLLENYLCLIRKIMKSGRSHNRYLDLENYRYKYLENFTYEQLKKEKIEMNNNL